MPWAEASQRWHTPFVRCGICFDYFYDAIHIVFLIVGNHRDPPLYCEEYSTSITAPTAHEKFFYVCPLHELTKSPLGHVLRSPPPVLHVFTGWEKPQGMT